MSNPIIVLAGLTKSYGDLVAVRDLSLEIERGEIFGFLGANGAGKTTTMRMLCGLVRPTSGHATIDGAEVWRDRYAVRSKFGYMAQKFSLYPDLTVLENMRFFAGASRVPPNELEKRVDRFFCRWIWKRSGTRRPAVSPVGDGNCSPSAARWSTSRRCFFSMSRPRGLIRCIANRCGICFTT